MCKFLIDEYAWQGAQWIVSAIVLNGLVLGAVYRPLTFDDLERVRRKWRKKQIKLEAKRLNVNVEQIKDNKSEESVSINSQNIDEADDKFEEQSMLPRVHQLQQNGSDVRYPNLRMRTVSTSSIDKSESNLNSMRTIGDSCHSLTWYASSMERLHENPAPERSALSVRSRASQKSKLAQEKQSFMDILKDVLNGVRDTMDFTMLTNPVFVIYGLSCIFCMAGKTSNSYRPTTNFANLSKQGNVSTGVCLSTGAGYITAYSWPIPQKVHASYWNALFFRYLPESSIVTIR